MTTRLLSSLRRVSLAAEHARNVDLAAPETDADTTPTPAVHQKTAKYVDPSEAHRRQARGVPVLTRGVSGAINGTNPDRIAG